MLTYIAIIITIHTLSGLYATISMIVTRRQNRKAYQENLKKMARALKAYERKDKELMEGAEKEFEGVARDQEFDRVVDLFVGGGT